MHTLCVFEVLLQDISFLLYAVFLLLMAFLVLVSKRDTWFYQVLVVFVFVFIVGYRNILVPDTKEYFDLFKLYNSSLLDMQYIGQEMGFVVFGKLIKLFFDSHILYFLSIALFNVMLVRLALVNLGLNVSLGLIAYISFYGLSVNFIFLRVGMAISVFLYGYSLLYRGKKVAPFLVFALAPFFHKSILLVILSLPLLKLQLKRYVCYSFLFVSFVLYYTGLTDFIILKIFEYIKLLSFLSRYTYYIDNIKFESGYSFRFLFNVVVLSVVIYKTSDFERMTGPLKVCLLGVFLTSFFSGFLWVDRIADAFVVFMFFIVTSFVCERSKVGRYKVLNVLTYFIFVTVNLVFVSRVLKDFLFIDVF